MTKAVEGLIPRYLDDDVAQILNEFSLGLEELVNFGSQIMDWDLTNENNSDEHLPAILFLRNFLEEIDAISILIKHSSIDPCKNLLRTALENFFSMEYILECDSYNRSMGFLIWNTVINNQLLRKADGKSLEFKDLVTKYKKDKLMKNLSPLQLPLADAMLLTGQKIFDLPKYKPIKTEYDTVAKKKSNPPWYSLFNGPNNMETLANRLGLPALYEVLYRGWSQAIHGNDTIQGKLLQGNEEIQITQIRNPKDAQYITQHCFNVSIMAFRTYIEKRTPAKVGEFQDWYLTIREFNLKLSQRVLINVV